MLQETADESLLPPPAQHGVEIYSEADNNAKTDVKPLKPIGYWGRCVMLADDTAYALALLDRAHRAPGQRLSLKMSNGTLRTGTVGLLPHVRLGNQDATTDERTWQRYYESAMQQFVEGHLEEAIDHMQTLTQQAPQFWQAREGLGVLLGRAERYTEAMQVLNTLVEENPHWPMAYTNLSIYALKLGDKEAAEHWKAEGTRIAMKLKFDEAMAAKKNNAVNEEEALKARQLRVAQLRERVELFKQALNFAPTDALAHYGMATALQELNEFNEAVAAYKTTIEHHPTHTQAYLGWAECLVALGDMNEAKTVASQGCQVASQRGDLQPLTKLQAILNS
jgi:tetratricopeptide (TPR) repeat protein